MNNMCLSLYSACEFWYFGVGYFVSLISLLVELDLCSMRESIVRMIGRFENIVCFIFSLDTKLIIVI